MKIRFQHLFPAFIFILSYTISWAQGVGIGTTTPDSTAILELSSTTKGALMPRMTTVQRDAIVAPAPGLMIINLDDLCVDIWNGMSWIKNCGVKMDTAAAAALGFWSRSIDFGGGVRSTGVGFSIGQKGYVGTGRNPNITSDFWEYDPMTRVWTQKASMPDARYGAVGFSIGQKGYVGLGNNISEIEVNDLWEYDPALNAWVEKASLPAPGRVRAVGFCIGSKGYVGTGADENNFYLDDFWEYDPVLDAWGQKASLSGNARYRAIGMSIGNKGYVGTGTDEDGAIVDDFWEYDAALDTWAQKADMPGGGRTAAFAFSIGDKGFAGSGVGKSDFWEYNPASDSWSQRPAFGGGLRNNTVAFSIGNIGYAGTGFQGTYFADFWEYHPHPVSVDQYSESPSVYLSIDPLWTKRADTLCTTSPGARLGLGLSRPGAKLHIQKDQNVSNAPAGDLILSRVWNSLTDTRASAIYHFYDAMNNDYMAFGVSGGGGPSMDAPNAIGQTKMVIQASGNVGIGNTAPSQKLHVTGKIRMEDASMGAGKVLTSDANGVGTWTTESDPQVSSSTTNKIPKWNGTTLTDGLMIDDGNKIGFNITTPNSRLHIHDPGGAQNAPSSDLLLSRVWNSVADTRASSIFHYYNTTTMKDNLAFGISGSGGTNNAPNAVSQIKMLIQADGNIGVGLLAPNANLHIQEEQTLVNTPCADLILSRVWNSNTDTRASSVYHYYDAGTLNDNLAFGVSGGGGSNGSPNSLAQTKMLIQASGNVGIGTLAPTQKLHVNGKIRMEDASMGAGKVLTSDANGVGTWTTESDPQISVATVNKIPKWNGTTLTDGLMIDDGNKIGFNITSPNSRLHIHDPAGAQNAPSSDLILSRVWNSPTDTRASSIFHYYSTTTTNDNLAFGVSGGGGTIGAPNAVSQIKMIIQGNGNTGIGTITPTEKLHVAGKIRLVDGTQGAAKVLTSDANGVGTWSVESDPQVASTTTNKIPKWNGTALTDGSMTNNGNLVGINIASPYAKLHIHEPAASQYPDIILSRVWNSPTDTRASAIFHRYNPVSSNDELAFGVSGEGWQYGAPNTPYYIKMSIQANGRVGIGTDYPTHRLTIGGTLDTIVPAALAYFSSGSGPNIIQLNNSGWGEVALKAEGTIWAWNGAFIATSDSRIKHIQHITDNREDLALLKQIQITDYKYIDSIYSGTSSHKKVIAQQIQSIFPQAINQSTGWIPNVYELAQHSKVENDQTIITTTKPHTFVDGDLVRLLVEKKGERVCKVSVLDAQTFSVEQVIPEKIFVYGKQIDDLLNVDYDAISMLNVSATQELSKQIEWLKAENEKLRAENSALKSDIEILKVSVENKLKALEAKLEIK